jgi:hypothetical protein
MIRRVSVIASTAVAAGVVALTTALPASAQPLDPPQSGDPRATAFAGNATTCAQAGLAGDASTVQFSIDPTNRYLTITSVPEDIELTGTVVKGGPAYNVYGPQHRTELHAPLVTSGKPAQISHWFACGTKKPQTTTPTTTTTTTTSSGIETTTTSGGAMTTTTPGGGGGGGFTGDGELAKTGGSVRGLLVAGTALLLLGAALLLLACRRAPRRR